MLRLTRPTEPAGFPAAVLAQADEVKARVQQGEAPEFHRYDTTNPPAWKPFKVHFADINRCAYCEVTVSSDRWGGDLEHFRPKEKVTSTGRRGVRGYWWLAYQWSNYLLACHPCNNTKRNRFPVADEAGRGWPPGEGDEAHERPLLLNPYDDHCAPARHLRFGDRGQVEGTDATGSTTVKTCGLDREALRQEREEKAKQTHAYCDAIERNDPLTGLALLAVFESGKAGYAHAGMVRIIFERRTGLTWTDLSDLVGPYLPVLP